MPILENVPFKEYVKLKALNSSSLKEMVKSPKHFWAAYSGAKSEFTETAVDDLDFGRAAHTYILEGAPAFLEQFVIMPEGMVKRGNAWTEFERDANGRDVVSAKNYKRLLEMDKAMRSHAKANEIINIRNGRVELTIQWFENSISCKARLDRLLNSPNVIIDYKTSKSIVPREFARSAITYGYHIQAAHYIAGLASSMNKPVEDIGFIFITQEKEYPFDVVVYEPSRDFIDYGFEVRSSLISQYEACTESGVWAGMSSDIEVLNLPYWAKSEEK